MADFFTADLHIGHGKVAELRGYETTELHDLAIIANLYASTSPGDTIWILGDLTVGREGDEKVALHLLSMALCDRTLRLITGNHDTPHPMRTRSAQRQELFQDTFSTVQSQASLKIAGQRALLHHFPYSGDHTGEERFTEWRARDTGNTVIHGHTHASKPISYSDDGTLQVCVSLDAHDMKPVSKDELTLLIEAQQK